MKSIENKLGIVLRECGFIQNDQRLSGLIDAETATTDYHAYLRYGTLFKDSDPKTDLIYESPSPQAEVPGTPCIYFKYMASLAPAKVDEVRKQLWNHGRIPTLWIVTDDATVRIYDSFARPQANDGKTADSHLLDELRLILDRLGEHGRINELHKSKFDTGEFWRSGKGQDIDPNQRVDSALLKDLSITEQLLVNDGLDSTIAHSLLGRSIFIKYLEDRRILESLDSGPYSGARDFQDLLNDKKGTYSFFGWLRRQFNGDLFPPSQDEESRVSTRHLDILQKFLLGNVMKNYPNTQSRFWPYSFDMIPIELISSIYEMFAHARDSEWARAISVHYTRFNLVELVLSLGMKGLTHTARVLDPACGSGVFLVEAFRRLAWMKEKELGRRLRRNELNEILRNQIFGLDIDRDAVYVAAFSLYLALLELDPDPAAPTDLKLPKLIADDKGDPGSRNLYIGDFFNVENGFNKNAPFSTNGFNIITGNPPWTALKRAKAYSGTKRAWALEYCERENIPDNKPDQAFMWRARSFIDTADSNAKIAFVISSRLFYQTSTKAKPWRDRFLSSNTVVEVVNLSDLSSEHILFGRGSSAGLPASVVVFTPREPKTGGEIVYITPKWYAGIHTRDEIVITSGDIQALPQNLLKENPFLWKTAYWGTPRDFRLIKRLLSYPSMGKVLLNAGVKRERHFRYGITFGRLPTKDASQLQGLPFLQSGAAQRYRIGLDACVPFNKPHIAEKSNTSLLPLPVLILSRALRDDRPCVALVEPSDSENNLIFDHMYYGISMATTHSSLPYRLNALLNSRAVHYLIFMLSSSLGWDWRTVEPNTWMQIPLPPSIEYEKNDVWRNVLVTEKRLRGCERSDAGDKTLAIIAEAEESINRYVYSLYGLSTQEIVLIESTIEHTVSPFLRRKREKSSLKTKRPTPDQLTAYVTRICTQLEGLLQHGDLGLLATILSVPRVGVTACRFELGKRSQGVEITQVQNADIDFVLREISDHLRAQVADHLYVNRDLRVYDGQSFWIIKPSEMHLWSEAAALNDADSIVREHMEKLPGD
ncbi:MAG: Eco57I restriction-modification methylase domain-containing protein [Dehalococcoidia bacterium]